MEAATYFVSYKWHSSRFAIATPDEIEQIKSDSIPQKTKDATKYGVEIFQGKHLFFNCLF